ncbi:MAG TPA: Crp/Fnr family transcriptional regulator [Pyrinomonadaceae bacterium]|nr:Crp/Fnr family transcriptional regulator [Pyrinomonadaceae bacterium]
MSVENRILASLPDGERQNIFPYLERHSLLAGKVLFEPGDRVRYIYFPINSIVSMLASMENGTTVEAGVVGNEGAVGISAILGAKTSTVQGLVQVAGQALSIPADLLMAEFRRGGKLQSLLLRHTHSLFTMVSQTAACNRLHTVEERLARRLLTTHDRVESDEFLLTQEFIARMLGTRRSGVTVAAGILQQAGLVNYRRGRINILNREGLEEVSCECYRMVKEEYDRYLND